MCELDTTAFRDGTNKLGVILALSQSGMTIKGLGRVERLSPVRCSHEKREVLSASERRHGVDTRTINSLRSSQAAATTKDFTRRLE